MTERSGLLASALRPRPTITESGSATRSASSLGTGPVIFPRAVVGQIAAPVAGSDSEEKLPAEAHAAERHLTADAPNGDGVSEIQQDPGTAIESEPDGAGDRLLDARIKGWCPGALRPMRSGDGLIVRLKISGGIVSTGLAARIAEWSHRWGNGQIDLSGRGNLQLRGLTERHLPALRDVLAGWNLLDTSEAGEAVRNVISSPLAGLDPEAVLDVRPVARALEQRLSRDVRLHALPGKFGFVIDDGGQVGLDDVAVDVRFKTRPGVDGPEFTVRLAAASLDLPGWCPPDAVPDVAARLGLAFLDARKGRENSIRRMRDLVAAGGAEAVGRAARLTMRGARDRERARASDPPSGHPDDRRVKSRMVILGLDPRRRERVAPFPLMAGLEPAITQSTDVRREMAGSGPGHDIEGACHDVGASSLARMGSGMAMTPPFPVMAGYDRTTAQSRDVRREKAGSGPGHDVEAACHDVGSVTPVRTMSGPIVIQPFPVMAGLDPAITQSGDVRQEMAGHDEAEQPAAAFLGVGLPYGRVAAGDLARLANAANAAGATELRLTPWRMILVPVSSMDAAHAIGAMLSDTAFILDNDDPRLRVAACPGAPSCARGTSPVREDATRLAARMAGLPGSGIVLHVSGCAKGCAHPREVAVTLVARDGRYDIILDGRASDPAIAPDLTLDEAVIACLSAAGRT